METHFRNYRHDGSKIARFRSSVAQSLDQISQLGDVVAQATKAAYPPAEAIFAAMRYLVGSANAVSADYDRLEAFFGELQAELQSLKILEGKLSRVPEYERALTGVFTSVLVLCGICKWSQALRTGQDEELKQATVEFHKWVKLGQNIILKATLANSLDIMSIMGTTQEDISRSLAISQSMDKNIASVLGDTGQVVDLFERQENNQERNATLNWLSQLDYLGKHRDTFAKRHERTGQWLLDHVQFNTWLSADENSVLWEPYTESEMFSSIILQLSQQISPLPSEVKSFYATWLGKMSYPTNDAYVALIASISKLFQRTFVFVDALDECTEETREGFIRLLVGLKPYIRLFLTPRGNVDVGATLGELRSIEIVADSADVRKFLEFNVDTSPRLSRLLPALAKKALSFIFCSKRTLSSTELLDALAIEEGTSGMYEESHPRPDILLGVCARLVTIDRNTDAIGFIHYTLQEYFQSHRSGLLPNPEYELMKACLTYLSLDIFDEGPCTSPESLERRLEQYCFYGYASQNWGSHVQDGLAVEGLELVLAFICSESKSASSLQVLYSGLPRMEARCDRFPGRLSKLHVAAYWGLCQVFAALQNEDDYHVVSQDSQGATALQLAAQYGYVQLHGIDLGRTERPLRSDTAVLTGSGGRPGGRCGRLDWAIIGRHNEAAKVLLDHSAPVFGVDRINKALILAAEAGNAEAVEILLDRGAEIDWTDDQGSSALDFAVAEGKEEVMLLANGADANAKDQDGWTPLHAAMIREHGCSLVVSGLRSVVNSGYHERVQALLTAGEDIDAVDGVGGSTALTLATWLGDVPMVKLLLENGAKVDRPDHGGDTALYIAAKEGYSELVKLLVHHGAPIDDTAYGWTPLLVAVKKRCSDGHAEVVEALIHGGANVRATDYHGRTALHSAAKYKDTALARDLIRRGASVDAQDQWGVTPLIRAIAGEHGSKADRMTDLLLQNQANVNIETFEGLMDLHGAVEFLRRRGCVPSEATQGALVRRAAGERLAADKEKGEHGCIDIDAAPNGLTFCKQLCEVVLDDNADDEQSHDDLLQPCAAMEKLTLGHS
ncbi:hypothetical protein PG994_003884 [Apiospora phragmitis]|uniref:Ankyrin repeat protein n=1 Tax=Apiospora phragmitis TaxID=2905665 RepID=A0ABR1W0N1_9PEZI